MARDLRLPAYVWLILVAATLVSYAFHFIEAHSVDIAGSAVLLVACFKVAMIGNYYMELRHAPAFLRWAFTGWVVALGTTLTILFWLGR